MQHMGSELTQTYNTTQGDQNVQHIIKHKSTTVSKDCVFNLRVQEDSLDTSTMDFVLLSQHAWKVHSLAPRQDGLNPDP